MTPGQPVLIAGGGIGGLALALALAGRGIASRCLERRQDLAEAGAGIQLGPNAVAILHRLGAAALLEPAVGEPGEIVVHDGASGRVLQRLPLGAWIRARHGMLYWVAHRQDLHAALLQCARHHPLIELTAGFEVARFATDGDGVRVMDEGGRVVVGRALVGADGVHSRVRQQLLPSRLLHHSGMTAARAVLPADPAREYLAIDAIGVWLAPRAHAVHYPVRGGRDLACVVIAPSTRPDPGWASELSGTDVLASAAGFAPRLRRALGQADQWRGWALFELPPLPCWSQGRVTLLGDAAHPTLPFLAQGGALALEDAWTLAAQMAGNENVMAALANFEQARKRRATRVAAMSRQNGWIFHLSGIAATTRNAVMSRLPPERIMARYDWIYGWRPQ